MFQQDINIIKKTDEKDAKFSIVIPTWNNLEYLKLCVDSIRKNSSFKHQIIIHVNAGNDGTIDWVKQQDDLDYSFSKDNVGVCYGLNMSRSLVYTDYILFLNDDMYVCPRWDKALLDEITAIGHNFFFLSATSIEPHTSNECAIEKDYGTNIKTFNEELLLKEFQSFEKQDWSGATWPPNIIHKSIWDMVGGYSIEFSPGMYSDPDFSMKLWKTGIRLFKGVSKSRVYHFGSKTVRKINKNQGYHTFIRKWGITSSTLTKYYLHRGQKYSRVLPDPKNTIYLRVKNHYKRLLSQFLSL